MNEIKTNKEKAKQIEYIDYFRAVAIVFIVLGHNVAFGRSTMHDTTIMFFQGGTDFFVFIAGFLFQHLAYKFETFTYYKNKLLNVICPYFVTLTPAVFLAVYHNPNPCSNIVLNGANDILRVLAIYFNGATVNGPTWFIGMIAFIFIFSPLILKLKQKNKKAYITLFLMSAITALIIHKNWWIWWGFTNDTTIQNFIYNGFIGYFKNALHFLFDYLLGMELYDFIKKNPNFIKENLKTIFSISLFLYVFHFVVQLYIVKDLTNMLFISKTIEIFVILSGLLIVEDRIKKIGFLDKALKFLAKYSFGIFFIHEYIRCLICYHSIFPQSIPSLVDIQKNTLKCAIDSWLVFFAVFFGCIIFLFITKKLLNAFGIKKTRPFIGV